MGLCDGRVVIVTGAGRGLGRAYALDLARHGARVVVNDLGLSNHGEATDETPADQVVAEIQQMGGEAMASFADVSDWAATGDMVAQTVDRFGRLDAVVNNAGFVRDRMFVSATPDEWDAVMAVHLRGHFCTARHAVDHWRARAKAGDPVSARIVNTTSAAGLQGSIGQSAYSAAKAGIAGLTLVQAAELSRYGITANAIAPQARTRMTEVFGDAMRAKEGDFDIYAPENNAGVVTWLCSTDSADVNGQVFEVLGGQLWLSQGWHDGPKVKKSAAAWRAEDVGPEIRRLVSERAAPKPVYGA